MIIVQQDTEGGWCVMIRLTECSTWLADFATKEGAERYASTIRYQQSLN